MPEDSLVVDSGSGRFALQEASKAALQEVLPGWKYSGTELGPPGHDGCDKEIVAPSSIEDSSAGIVVIVNALSGGKGVAVDRAKVSS